MAADVYKIKAGYYGLELSLEKNAPRAILSIGEMIPHGKLENRPEDSA